MLGTFHNPIPTDRPSESSVKHIDVEHSKEHDFSQSMSSGASIDINSPIDNDIVINNLHVCEEAETR